MKTAAPRVLLPCLLLMGITLLVFHGIGRAHFVAWDDGIHVFRNPYLHPVTWAHMGHFWAHPYKNLYIPVAYDGFSLLALLAHLPSPVNDPQLGPVDLSPAVFHLASLGVHCANALLVFVLLRRVAGQAWPAFAGALLFAIHPVQSESVAWVSEMRGLLSAFFSLLALLLYGRKEAPLYPQAGEGEAPLAPQVWGEDDVPRETRFAHASKSPVKHAPVHRVSSPQRWGVGGAFLATLCFALALLCKPSAAALPLVAWAWDWGAGRGVRVRAPLLLLWLAGATALAWVTHSVQPTGEIGAVPAWARFFVAGDALAFYVGKLLWPARLGIDYGRTPQWVLSHGWGYATWLVPVALGGLLWWQRRRFPALAASGLVFAAALLPVLGLASFVFQRYSTVADRYAYLAMLGPALALAWALSRWPGRAGWGIAAVWLVLLGRQSAAQATFWQDSVSLFTRAIAVNPRTWVGYNNRGYVLAGEGQFTQAVADYQHSLAINPAYVMAHVNLGAALEKQGKTQEARTQYQMALRLAPGDADAHYDLANLLAAAGQTEQSVAEYQAALRVSPGMALAHNNLGISLATLNRLPEAAAQFQEAVRLAPEFAGAHANLAHAFDAQGRAADGANEYAEAARLAPDDADTRNNLGVDLEMLGRPQEALAQFQEAVRLRPDFAGARRNLEMARRQPAGKGNAR